MLKTKTISENWKKIIPTIVAIVAEKRAKEDFETKGINVFTNQQKFQEEIEEWQDFLEKAALYSKTHNPILVSDLKVNDKSKGILHDFLWKYGR